MINTTETNFEYFVYQLFGPIVILLGIFGNSLGLIVPRRRDLDELGPKNTYKYLFLIDMICLPIIFNNYMIHAFGIGFSTISWMTCKIYMQYAYIFSSISPMVLVYILVERYLSIKFPVESNFLRNKKTQLVYISMILIFNFFYFLYIPFISDIKIEKLENLSYAKNITLCKIVSSKDISSVLVFLARIFVPLILIVIFSIMLVTKVVTARTHMNTFYDDREKIIYKKDAHLSILAIVSNFIIIFLNFPLYAMFFIFKTDKNVWFVFALHIYHLSYVFQFYFFIIANSIFRKAFISIFKRSNKTKRNTELNPERIEMFTL